MESVHERPDERDLRYLRLVHGRVNLLAEDEIAKQAGCGSPAELYRRLANDGFPVCGVCGTTHAGRGHCEDQTRKRQARRSGGEKRELRPAAGAAGLFRVALARLEHDIAELSRRREYMQDERFVVERHLSGEAREAYNTYRRAATPEAVWRELCEEHGADPSADWFTVWVDRVVSGGVSWAPPEPLTRLIAVYILAGQPLEPLLRVLHDDPEGVDDDQLDMHIRGKKVGKDKIPGLVSKAQMVARLVRGGTLRTGARTGDLSRREEEAAAYIRFQRSRGVADAKILHELRDGFGFSKPSGIFADPKECSWPDMTMGDLERLGGFRLPSVFDDET